MANVPEKQHTNEDVRELNRARWNKLDRVLLEDYSSRYGNRTFKEDSQHFHSLVTCADVYADYAFCFSTLGHDAVAQQAAERTIRAAQEALRLESFEAIFAAEVRNQSPYKEMEKEIGRMRSLIWWHYGLWFSTGERPIELLQQAAVHHQEYYNLLKSARRQILDDLMMNYVEAEEFEKALNVFNQDYRGKVAPPRSAQFNQSKERTLAALAKYASGDQEMKNVAQKTVETWYQKASNWSVRDWELPWNRRLSWAWLRGRHFTGVVELRPLLRELRGF